MKPYPLRMAHDAADTLAYLCTSPYDATVGAGAVSKIHFHPLREHAGLTTGGLIVKSHLLLQGCRQAGPQTRQP